MIQIVNRYVGRLLIRLEIYTIALFVLIQSIVYRCEPNSVAINFKINCALCKSFFEK